jgi:beta-N-acetylhexosaminidase
MKILITAISLISSSLLLAQSGELKDRFFSNDTLLDQKVDSVFNTLDDNAKVAQLIMPAVGKYGQTQTTIDGLIRDNKIGGVLLLNGTKDQFENWTKRFESMNEKLGHLPFLYSADAEPTLVNRKMKGSTPVKKAVEINSMEDVYTCANTISDDLNDVGINYNFAPVVDVAKNSTVGYRGFGAKPENIIPYSLAFIEQTQSKNIIATAKHFPGHGLVSGDTHKSLQVIDGELKELQYYPPLIERGVLSIMVAHIAVKNNEEFSTNGLPATTSRKIVTELLRDSLGFNGLIVTDAMNMGGVVNVPNCYVKSIDAGCDILLMPKDARKAHKEILSTYSKDGDFKSNVDESVKRLIRMKICLGII